MSELRDERQPGWWWAHDAVLDVHAKELGVHALGVYMAFCRHANKRGQCWPSISRLAKMLAIAPNTVRVAVAKLMERGLIACERRGHFEGDSDSHLYTLLPVQGGTARAEVPPSPTPGGVLHRMQDGTAPGEPEGNTGKETQEKDSISATRRARRAAQLPEPFELTDTRRRFAEQGGFDVAEVGLMFGHFKDHHRAKGTLMKDWEAAWRTWCRRAREIAHERQLRSVR